MYNIPNEVNFAISKLNGSGFEAYLVGGCVRDFLMDIEPCDWDITTNAIPEEIKKVFGEYRTVDTGIKHGTVTVIIDCISMEITTFRSDGIYLNNRKPASVEYVKSLKEDLSRRDFTINSIAYSPFTKPKFHSMYGGIVDINNKIIRTVGEPSVRFKEDALRILRGVRFSSVHGFKIEEETLKSMLEYKELLLNISVERIKTEMDKILCGKYVGYVLRNYRDILSVVVPEIVPMFEFEHNPHQDFDIWEHSIKVVENIEALSILRWAAFFHSIGRPSCSRIEENAVEKFSLHTSISTEIADEIMRRLKFDNKSRNLILTLIEYQDLQIQLDKKYLRRCLNKFGEKTLFYLIKVFVADVKGQNTKFLCRLEKLEKMNTILMEIIKENLCFSLKDLDINGDDIKKLGYEGREIGEALERLLLDVIDEKVENDRDKLIAYFLHTENKFY